MLFYYFVSVICHLDRWLSFTVEKRMSHGHLSLNVNRITVNATEIYEKL